MKNLVANSKITARRRFVKPYGISHFTTLNFAIGQVAALVCLLFKEIAVGNSQRAHAVIAAAQSSQQTAAVQNSLDKTEANEFDDMEAAESS